MTRPGPTPKRPYRAARAGRGLLAVLVGVLLVLAGIVVGAVPAAAQNAVGASTFVAANTVGVSTDIGAGQRLGKTVPQPQIVVATAVAAETGAMAIRPPLSIGSKQLGTKWGRHAADYGLDPASSSSRSWFISRVRDVHLNPDEVRRGAWRGGGENYFFFRRGEDLVLTQPDGTFVTMFPGASTSGWFKSAEVFPH